MRPTERGGVILEGPHEISLALNTVTASLADIGAAASSPQDHAQIKALGHRIFPYTTGEAGDLELSPNESGTLRDACRVAAANTQFAVGYLTCFGEMLRLPGGQALEAAMLESRLLRQVERVAGVGSAANELAGLFALYGNNSPEV